MGCPCASTLSTLKHNHIYKGTVLPLQVHMHCCFKFRTACAAQCAGWGIELAVWCAWTAQAQCTEVKFQQPLITRECLPEQVWSAGNESHRAWTAGGVIAVHWLMLRLFNPSSSYLPFIDSHIAGLFFTRLWTREYIALSVMFRQ
jgi:hypothetical protein